MKKIVVCVCLFFLAMLLQLQTTADACTGTVFKATDGSVVAARTLEFAKSLNSDVIFVPRGYSMTGMLPENKSGLTWASKYAYIGANAAGEPVIVDGFNEKGLYFGNFFFPSIAKFEKLTPENSDRAIAPIQFGNWVLSNFATVDEVQKSLKNVAVIDFPENFKGLGAMTYHYSIVDASGNAIVVEAIDGKLVIHKNTLGSITNDPEYTWHMTNITNYVNLSPVNPAPLILGSDSFKTMSQGVGLHGIPGDFSSPSRFVRVSFFKSLLPPLQNSDEAVFQSFHVLNNFDIPKGASENIADGKKSYDITQWMSSNDLAKKRYYFRTYNDYGIRVIDFMNLDLNAKEIKVFSMKGVQPAVDITKSAENFKK